jgi:hypothetical protein
MKTANKTVDPQPEATEPSEVEAQLFVRQVEDRSRPATTVLADQAEAMGVHQLGRAFVP